MSGSISSQTSTSSSSSASTSSGQSGQNALVSLTDNYQSFLQMLMTQLQNQDPTSPMDTGQFTSELVQFAGVEQQINTNTSLTQLIQATQANNLIQASQIVGKQVQVTSNQLSLQNGTAGLTFTSASGGTTAIGVFNSAGQQIYSENVNAAQGSNSWTWNGQTASGSTEPDGAYTVAVASVGPNGSSNTLPFSVIGTVTSVQEQGSSVQLQLGQLGVGMSSVTSVMN